jgi:hypothetical protein
LALPAYAMPKPRIEHCLMMVYLEFWALSDNKPKAISFSSLIPAEHKPIPKLAPALIYFP